MASPQGDTMILFSVGESTFAIPAAVVDEIRNTDGLKAFCSTVTGSAKVTHTLVRDAKTYWVVNACAHFEMPSSPATRLLLLRNRSVAFLVGRIDHMAEIGAIHAVPQAFGGKERQWYRGLAVLAKGAEQAVVPVVDPEAFLSRQEAETLAAELKRR